MKRPQIVLESWRSRQDLLELKAIFYDHQAEHVDVRRQGCHRVQAWESSGRVPHVIVSTAELTQALLAEKDQRLPVPVIVNGLCTAWVRFVNGSTDTQQQFRSKQSMYQIARHLGMPASFIELRHRITHEDKPSLRELIRAANQGLSWLYRWYWRGIADSGAADGKPEADAHSLTQFQSDVLSALDAMLDRNIRTWVAAEDKTLVRADVNVTVQEIEQLYSSDPRRLTTFCDLLCTSCLSVPRSIAVNVKHEAAMAWSKPFADVNDAPFYVYDEFLLKFARSSPKFVPILQQTLLKQVVSTSSKSAIDANAGAVLWLYHFYSDAKWAKHVRAGFLDPEAATKLCTDSGNCSAEQLLKLLGGSQK